MRRGWRFSAVALVVAAACWVLGQADYPGAKWVPADPGNYTVSNRPVTYPIEYIVIHVMQGSYQSAINWFQNPASNVSAHYLFRSSDGDVTQMVREKDIGYHAGNWNYNTWSIGIEHEGFVNDPSWFTQTMYESSARLSRYITVKYDILRTRNYVIGHVEVPGATHTDPGPNWNWNLYMALMRLAASYDSSNFPTAMNPGQVLKVSVSFNNLGDDPWPFTGPEAVHLATANPFDHASVFYYPSGWISSSRAAVADRFGSRTRSSFNFAIRAPSNPGIYTEHFQLYKNGVGRFGPIVSFTVAVGVTDTVQDNDGPNFEAIGTWSTGSTAPGHYGADYRFANTPSSNYCNWYLNSPTDGYYDVYAWWSQGTNRTDAATYQVRTSASTFDYVVNQQILGGQWNLLGRHWLPQGDGFVRLLATGPSSRVAIADAVRFVGPFPNP